MYVVKQNLQGLGAAGPAPSTGNTGKIILVVVGIAVIAALLKPVIWG